MTDQSPTDITLQNLAIEVRRLADNSSTVIKTERYRFYLGIATVMILVSLAGIGFAIGLHLANERIDRQFKADCPQHKALAESPLSSTTTILGRNIVKFNADAYRTKKCEKNYGPLSIPPTPTPTK